MFVTKLSQPTGPIKRVAIQGRLDWTKIQLATCAKSKSCEISPPAISRLRAMVNTHLLTEDAPMSRHLNNLKRLWSKLQLRYGSDDPLVLEVKREIDAIEARDRNWMSPQRDLHKAGAGKFIPKRMDQGLAA
jgi:hypothetical protein